MNIYENFLEHLEKAVILSGNKNKLAENVGVHANLITRWINRERVPSLHSIQPIADLLGLTLVGRGENIIGTPFSITEFEKLKEDNTALKVEISRLQAQLDFAKDVLTQNSIKEKAPDKEASEKDAKYYLSSGTEGE